MTACGPVTSPSACAGRPGSRWARSPCHGLKLEVFGDANDYVGKGLSGATIVVRPTTASPLESQNNSIVGNTVLYGATSGRLFAAGQAGERFCVRNSDAVAVVEGCGANGCEYMTGGTAVILGNVGPNFGAGMTGGMAYVYDPDGDFEQRVNADQVIWQRIQTDYWESAVRDLIAEHVRETQSRFAERLLIDWQSEREHFWQVVPKEIIPHLEQPLTHEGREARAEPAE